ncbi:unnamed protein product [Schistosoma spindalis]|nr:unnamed protein product [Schistosoma spindale]
MGNCLKISNYNKRSNSYLNNKLINTSSNHLQLLRNIYHNYNNIDYSNSISMKNLNELNQYFLLNNHKFKQLNYNIHDLLNENSLNKLHSYSILNSDDHDISNDRELNYDFLFLKKSNSIISNYHNIDLLIENKFKNYFIPINNEKIEHTTIITTTNTTNITISKNQNNFNMLKSTNWPLINTSILGFTVLKSNMLNLMEWLQYNENETYSKINLNQLSIKDKQIKTNDLNETNTNINNNILLPSGWLRYTMFIYQTKLDIIEFLIIFHRMKYYLHSLEIKTGCKILISKCLFMYKGNLVRKFVIDGPNKKQILQCYSSLPQLFIRLLILKCDRPSTL